MNEFWNVVITAICFFIGGLAVHSALGHTYGDLMNSIFHRDTQPPCFNTIRPLMSNDCVKCNYRLRCVKAWLSFTE